MLTQTITADTNPILKREPQKRLWLWQYHFWQNRDTFWICVCFAGNWDQSYLCRRQLKCPLIFTARSLVSNVSSRFQVGCRISSLISVYPFVRLSTLITTERGKLLCCDSLLFLLRQNTTSVSQKGRLFPILFGLHSKCVRFLKRQHSCGTLSMKIPSVHF